MDERNDMDREHFTFKQNPGLTVSIKPGAKVPRPAWAAFRKSNAQIAREARTAAWSELQPARAPDYVSDAEWSRRARGKVLASYGRYIPLPGAKCPGCSKKPHESQVGHLLSHCCGALFDSVTGEPVTRGAL